MIVHIPYFEFNFTKERGHRVRLASHANFRDFVMDEGLEFYPLGGDPKVLAECNSFLFCFKCLVYLNFHSDMVKNKGFLPSRPSEVTKQRNQLKSILYSTWPACIEPDSTSNGQPFTADAIIANPPAMGIPIFHFLLVLDFCVLNSKNKNKVKFSIFSPPQGTHM